MEKQNILTIQEALTAIKRDSDLDSDIAILLDGIDDIAYQSTGVKWHKLTPVPPLAKMWARLYLQIDTGFVTNPTFNERLTSLMKQMQLMDIDDIQSLIDINDDTVTTCK
ncbi:MAG: hypothetical protein FWF56_03485 [Firmicutes bacterium]|nr:hypothetical protein [Bacillota bacterium]